MTTLIYPYGYNYAPATALDELSYLLMGPSHQSMDPFQDDYLRTNFDLERYSDGYSSSDYSSGTSSPQTTPPQPFLYGHPTEKSWTADNGLRTFASAQIPTLPSQEMYHTPILSSSIYTPPFTPTYYETPFEQANRKRKLEDVPDLSINLKTKVVRSKVKNNNLQCAGINRKKNCQCKNAALMEYIGPKPIYCAEHIELDPNTLYEKCKSSYYKTPGDGKCCKEVVLKEFGMCHKHFSDLIAELISRKDVDRCNEMCDRLQKLHAQTESEANSAKKKDSDLFQRKNKLLPKFSVMLKMASEAVQTMTKSSV